MKPSLPQQVSNDGREIWDWAAKLSRISALQQKASELRKSLRESNKVCGGCTKWMTDACPKEKLQRNGYKRGPHMKEPGCMQYAENSWTTGQRAKWQAELDEVNATLAQPEGKQ